MTINGNGANGTLASNREAMDRFLARLQESGNVLASCRAAGVPRRTVYNWRERFVTFRDEWDDAMEDACDILEATAWKRAVSEGSDRLLMFLLKAHRADKYGDRAKVEHSGPEGGPIETKDVTLTDDQRDRAVSSLARAITAGLHQDGAGGEDAVDTGE